MTIFILIVSMFFLGVILLINIGIMNKNANQEKELDQLSKNYKVTDKDMEQTYLKALGEDTFVTMDDVQKMIEEVKENMQKEMEGKIEETKEQVKNETKEEMQGKIDEAKKEAKLEIYPIGGIYITTNQQNPQSYIGGTWERYGVGKTLLSTNGTSGQTGGSNTVTLATKNLPSHSHTISHTHTTPATSVTWTTGMGKSSSSGFIYKGGTVGVVGGTWDLIGVSDGTGYMTSYSANSTSVPGMGLNHTHSISGTIPKMTTNSISTTSSGNTGSGTAFSVQNEYITVYVWRRTA